MRINIHFLAKRSLTHMRGLSVRRDGSEPLHSTSDENFISPKFRPRDIPVTYANSIIFLLRKFYIVSTSVIPQSIVFVKKLKLLGLIT